jgi:hypothetical protein
VNAMEKAPAVIETTTHEPTEDSILKSENLSESIKINNTKNNSGSGRTDEKNKKFFDKGSVDFELL